MQHPSRCTATPASSRYRGRLRVGIPGRIKSESAPSCSRERTRASRTYGRTHFVIRTRSVVIGAPTGGKCNTSYYYKKGTAGSPRAQPLLPCSFCYVTPMHGGRAFGDPPMGRKPLGHRALSPAERQKKWRLQWRSPTISSWHDRTFDHRNRESIPICARRHGSYGDFRRRLPSISDSPWGSPF